MAQQCIEKIGASKMIHTIRASKSIETIKRFYFDKVKHYSILRWTSNECIKCYYLEVCLQYWINCPNHNKDTPGDELLLHVHDPKFAV